MVVTLHFLLLSTHSPFEHLYGFPKGHPISLVHSVDSLPLVAHPPEGHFTFPDPQPEPDEHFDESLAHSPLGHKYGAELSGQASLMEVQDDKSFAHLPFGHFT